MKEEDLVAGGFLKVKEVADFLGVSRSHVYDLMAEGQLRSSLFGKSRRVPRNEVLRYAREHLEPVE